MNETARRVAFALCPPADGFYDDEQRQVRTWIAEGKVQLTKTRVELEYAINHLHANSFGTKWLKPWGTYRMPPE